MALLALYEPRGRLAEVLQLVAFVLWRIWKCRNALVFTGVLVQPCDAVALLLKQVDEFTEVQAAGQTQLQQRGVPPGSVGEAGSVWSCPPPGFVKLWGMGGSNRKRRGGVGAQGWHRLFY
ncbi:unnamed protein product [Prunus armeniaca]|uniref:Uncharacterized protein n=1 Tax=Prunus armeniaca TaxID=36596 RepID=A0A6J5XKH0_PRUAR|nr:hypothetical protein GBA52_019967 [Prunus armeniaca]CAB4314239.1 unnamed protein product [Prunus armeniaca]